MKNEINDKKTVPTSQKGNQAINDELSAMSKELHTAIAAATTLREQLDEKEVEIAAIMRKENPQETSARLRLV